MPRHRMCSTRESSSGSTRSIPAVTSTSPPCRRRGVPLDWRHRNAPGERRAGKSTATGCNGGNGRTTSCPVAAGVCRRRYLRHLSWRLRDESRAHAPRAGGASPIAGRRARLRDLPRSWPGACRRRIQGTHQAIHRCRASRRQRDVPHLPQPQQPRGLGRQRARSPESRVHDVSQRPQSAVAAASTRQGHRNAAVRHLSSPAGREDRAGGRAHAGSRRQDDVLVVPQPARVDQQRQER